METTRFGATEVAVFDFKLPGHTRSFNLRRGIIFQFQGFADTRTKARIMAWKHQKHLYKTTVIRRTNEILQ